MGNCNDAVDFIREIRGKIRVKWLDIAGFQHKQGVGLDRGLLA